MDRPFDEIELADALRPFGQSRMLPAAAYTSARVLAWQRRHLFAGGWTCVGRQPDPAVTQWAVTDARTAATFAAQAVARSVTLSLPPA
jgi:Rieske 2Fe-2S family protein